MTLTDILSVCAQAFEQPFEVHALGRPHAYGRPQPATLSKIW